MATWDPCRPPSPLATRGPVPLCPMLSFKAIFSQAQQGRLQAFFWDPQYLSPWLWNFS